MSVCVELVSTFNSILTLLLFVLYLYTFCMLMPCQTCIASKCFLPFCRFPFHFLVWLLWEGPMFWWKSFAFYYFLYFKAFHSAALWNIFLIFSFNTLRISILPLRFLSTLNWFIEMVKGRSLVSLFNIWISNPANIIYGK